MKEYAITFTKYYTYYVEANNEDTAINIAEKEFEQDMHSSVADTTYDEITLEEN